MWFSWQWLSYTISVFPCADKCHCNIIFFIVVSQGGYSAHNVLNRDRVTICKSHHISLTIDKKTCNLQYGMLSIALALLNKHALKLLTMCNFLPFLHIFSHVIFPNIAVLPILGKNDKKIYWNYSKDARWFYHNDFFRQFQCFHVLTSAIVILFSSYLSSKVDIQDTMSWIQTGQPYASHITFHWLLIRKLTIWHMEWYQWYCFSSAEYK